MKLPELKRDRKAKKRYAIYYYKMVGDNLLKQDTSGHTDDLPNAYGRIGSHLARSELLRDEYAMALLIDRQRGRILRRWKRNAHGITYEEIAQ